MAIISTLVETIGRGGFPGLGAKMGIIENQMDFSATNVAASDVVEALSIPAGTLVTYVGIEVTTVEGGTLTFVVGMMPLMVMRPVRPWAMVP